jgi:hypothetical protein
MHRNGSFQHPSLSSFMSFFLDEKERKNQDAKKLPPAWPNAGPLLRLPTAPS